MDRQATPAMVSRPLLVGVLTAGAFLSFFVFGFIDNLKGPVLPALLPDLGLTYGRGGGLLLGAYLGFVGATLLAGPLADAVGSQRVLVLAGALIATGILGFSMASTYPLLFTAMLVLGLGMGAIEVGGNGLVVELHRARQGRYLNLLATFHGIGSLLVPLYAAWLLQTGTAWRQVYQYTLPLALALVIFFLLAPALPARAGPGAGFNPGALRSAGTSRPMLRFYAAIGLYVSTELGIGAWIVEYLLQAKGFGLAAASFYLSAFFAAIMLGRLAGSFIVERIGYLRSIRVVTFCALLCLVAGIYGDPSWSFFLPLSGFFLSIIFPTITAAVSRLFPHNTGTMLGLLFAAGGLGGALGPWAIGLASDWMGMAGGFGIVVFFCAGVIVALVGQTTGEPGS